MTIVEMDAYNNTQGGGPSISFVGLSLRLNKFVYHLPFQIVCNSYYFH